jgi:hypothetical protein
MKLKIILMTSIITTLAACGKPDVSFSTLEDARGPHALKATAGPPWTS